MYKKSFGMSAFVITATYSLFVIVSLFFLPNFVSAETAGDIAKNTLQQSFASETGVTQASVGEVISSSVTIILGMLGIIFFILAVYAGFLWTTAQGDEGKIGEAKQTIVRATLGFVVVISSYALSSLITTQFASLADNASDTSTSEGDAIGPVGCCLDRVSATGRPGSSGTGVWTDRMATENECSIVGNDPNDPGDVRYGPGTWDWDGNITPATEDYEARCEALRAAKAGDEDGGSDNVSCSAAGGTCQLYSRCKDYIETDAGTNAQSCASGQRCCIPKPLCGGGGKCRSRCQSGESPNRNMGCPTVTEQICCVPN
jgi:hypothetical protein